MQAALVTLIGQALKYVHKITNNFLLTFTLHMTSGGVVVGVRLSIKIVSGFYKLIQILLEYFFYSYYGVVSVNSPRLGYSCTSLFSFFYCSFVLI